MRILERGKASEKYVAELPSSSTQKKMRDKKLFYFLRAHSKKESVSFTLITVKVN